MDSAKLAVWVLGIVAVIGVFTIYHDPSGAAIFIPPQLQSRSVCVPDDYCGSGWNCCLDNRCVCASDEDSHFYDLLSHGKMVSCYSDEEGLLHCGGDISQPKVVYNMPVPKLPPVAESTPSIKAQARPMVIEAGVPNEQGYVTEGIL